MADWIRGAIAVTLQFGLGVVVVGIIGVAIYGVFYPFFAKVHTFWQNTKARELGSFTVYTKDRFLNAASIANVQSIINKEIIKRWINARTIIGITHSPHIEGHQFTVWYKEKPIGKKYHDPKPTTNFYPNNIKRLY